MHLYECLVPFPMSLVGKVLSVTPKGYAVCCVSVGSVLLPKKGTPKLTLDSYVSVDPVKMTQFSRLCAYVGPATQQQYDDALESYKKAGAFFRVRPDPR
jgi:hypothetical protein